MPKPKKRTLKKRARAKTVGGPRLPVVGLDKFIKIRVGKTGYIGFMRSILPRPVEQTREGYFDAVLDIEFVVNSVEFR